MSRTLCVEFCFSNQFQRHYSEELTTFTSPLYLGLWSHTVGYSPGQSESGYAPVIWICCAPDLMNHP